MDAITDVEEFRRRGKEMVDFIADYYVSIEERRVRSEVEPGYLRERLPADPPAQPDAWESIVSDVEEHIMPGVTHWNHPNFFAYFPANATFAGILADMLSGAIGCIGFSWICSPACTELETIMMDWLAKILSLPDKFLSDGKGGGVIQGTASEALIVSLLAARQRARTRWMAGQADGDDAVVVASTGDDEDADSHADGGEERDWSGIDSKLVAYCSDQTHSSLKKGARICGIRTRTLPTDDNFALQVDAVEAAFAEDVAEGLIPFFICGTVGTTSSTAIDNLPDLGPFCNEHNIWLHVDAAYAGTACICPEFRPLIDGVENADSFNFNPHKWMGINFDCSALWVSNRSDLLDALSATPEYLRNRESETGLVTDYKDWQIPLGRRFRSLKIWFVLRSYGVDGLQAMVREHIRLATVFEELVADDNRFEIVAPRTLALVCFRLKGSNEMNKELEDRLNAAGKLFLVHTALDGQYTLRFVVCTPRTTEAHVREAWQHIQAKAEEVLIGLIPGHAC